MSFKTIPIEVSTCRPEIWCTWLENLSNSDLPDHVLRVMSLEPMFAVPFFKTTSFDNSWFRPVPIETILYLVLRTKLVLKPFLLNQK